MNPKNIKETSPVINKHVKTMENKLKSNKRGTKEYNMGYDIVEVIKKTRANISLFELCNLPRQRKKLLEAFDP